MGLKASLTKGKFRAARAVAAAALLGLLTAGCGPGPEAQRPPEPGDQAVARVNGQTIWASDVKREAVAEGLIGPGDPLAVSSDLFRQVLDEVIDTRVLAAEALARHLDNDPLAQRRLTAARERALENIIVDNVVGRAVNQQAETALYQEMLKTQTPTEEIQLRRIIVATQPDADQILKALKGGASGCRSSTFRSAQPASTFTGPASWPVLTPFTASASGCGSVSVVITPRSPPLKRVSLSIERCIASASKLPPVASCLRAASASATLANTIWRRWICSVGVRFFRNSW